MLTYKPSHSYFFFELYLALNVHISYTFGLLKNFNFMGLVKKFRSIFAHCCSFGVDLKGNLIFSMSEIGSKIFLIRLRSFEPKKKEIFA